MGKKEAPSPGVLPTMAYTGRLRLKGLLFAGFRCVTGVGFQKLELYLVMLSVLQ